MLDEIAGNKRILWLQKLINNSLQLNIDDYIKDTCILN